MICHNPYFNRWISAISKEEEEVVFNTGHNPYFSRWFSAIDIKSYNLLNTKESQSLF